MDGQAARGFIGVSRETVLKNISTAMQTGASDAQGPHHAPIATPSHAAEEVTALFIERLEEYEARVFRASPLDLRATIAHVLHESGKTRMLVPPEIPAEWLEPSVCWVIDQCLPNDEIESFDGVLTSATAGVAESGSIVLRHGPSEGRRVLTLLPDYHLCVLMTSQIAPSLPACMTLLAQEKSLPITFISGPSATADIEMTRIKGVHGPRFLDVVLVRDYP